MMNLLFLNSRKIVKKVYNFQQYFVFGRIRDFLTKKTKENVDDRPTDIPIDKPIDKLIVVEDAPEYRKSKKKIKENKIDVEETMKIKGKVKKTLKFSDKLQKEKDEIFTENINMLNIPKMKKTSDAKLELRIIKKEEKIRQMLQINKVLIDELINDIKLEKSSQTLIELKPEQEVKSIYRKLEIYEEFANGSIALEYIFGENNQPMLFENKEKYFKWKERQLINIKKQIKFKLTPREEWITQHKGINLAYTTGLEHPRTGEYWDFNKVGLYACKLCTQRLFSSTHKYDSKSGHATFWNYFPYTLDFRPDVTPYPEPTQSVTPIFHQNSQPVRRICCSNCESHLGLVFENGPPPFFKRLLVNSSAVKFIDIGWFESPDAKKIRKKIDWIKKLKIKKNKELVYMDEKEKDLKKVISNLQETLEFEEQLNSEIIISNYQENVKRIKESKKIEEELVKDQQQKVEEQKSEEENKKKNIDNYDDDDDEIIKNSGKK